MFEYDEVLFEEKRMEERIDEESFDVVRSFSATWITLKHASAKA